MKICGYLKTSLIEWPGNFSAVLFVPGCNFRCPFCHNRDLVLNPQKLPKFSEKEIFADLEKRKKWIEAVVISGGEPTFQKDLSKFLEKIKRISFLTMIETNGSNPSVIRKLIANNLLDYIAVDFKAPLDNSYAQAIGIKGFDHILLLDSIKIIFGSGIACEIRTTIVPGIHNRETLILMAKQLKKIRQITKHKAQSFHWYLQTFQPKNCLDSKFEKIKPYSKMEMEKFLMAVKKIIPQAELR